MRRRIEEAVRRVRSRVGHLTDFFVTSLSAVKYIQAVAAEQREARRLADLNSAYRRDLQVQNLTGYVATGVPGLMLSLATAAVFLAGGKMVLSGALSLGTLVAFTTYLARATGPVQSFLGLYPAYQRARVSLTRVMEVAAVAPEVPRAGTLRPAMRASAHAVGELAFDHVWFRFAPDLDWVLQDITVQIPAGTKVGIVGASGVGKTTLIDLLHRHYEPVAGTIRLDGVDLRDFDISALRRAIAVVDHTPILFKGSFRDNIRYAVPEADDEAVEAAARRAQLHDHIAALPRGYDSDIGVDGRALSAGQRQRLSIARALLQEPLVLVLDEATADLDSPTEQRLLAEIDALFAHRTRIIISHHDRTIKGADCILRLAGGHLTVTPVQPKDLPTP